MPQTVSLSLPLWNVCKLTPKIVLWTIISADRPKIDVNGTSIYLGDIFHTIQKYITRAFEHYERDDCVDK